MLMSKRSFTFVILAVLVWSVMATIFAGYYYTQSKTYSDQLHERQQSMKELAENCESSAEKLNAFAGDYGALFGDFKWFLYEKWFSGDNCSVFLRRYGNLVDDLEGNYSSLLDSFSDLNHTFNTLYDKYQRYDEQKSATEDEFGDLLEEYYELLTSLAMKELSKSIGEAVAIKVSLCVDYSNTTIVWYNKTSIFPGSTLFDLTQKAVQVEPEYWPLMEPGHVTVKSINNYAEGYWLWYYWDEQEDEWIFGPVGCDAWMLRDGGIYKWYCSS